MKLILSILLIFFGSNLFSQVPASYSFSENENFAPKVVFDLHEDSNRNMWFGTNQGLFKWNGTEFQKFQNHNYSSNYSSIQEDSSGRIWCLNFTGQLFYVFDDTLILFTDEKELVQSIFDYSVSYFPSIYLTSNFGLIQYDFKTKKRNIYSENKQSNNYKIDNNNDTLYHQRIELITPYKNGLLYFSGIHLKYKENNTPSKTLGKITRDIFSFNPFIFPYEDKILLIGNLNKKGQIKELKGNLIKDFSAQINYMINGSSVYYDSKKELYFIGSKDGLYILNENFQLVFKKKILNEMNISKILKDFEGNYWISTLNDGIHIIPSLDILHYNDTNIQNKQISFIIKDNEHHLYFIDMYGEIYKIQKDNVVSYLGSFNERVENVFYNPYKNEISAGNLKYSFDLTNNTLRNNTYSYNTKSVSFLSKYIMLVSGSGSSSLKLTSQLNKKPIQLISVFSDSLSFSKNKTDNSTFYTIRSKRSTHNAFDFKNKIAYISYTDGLYSYKGGQEEEILFHNKPILINTMSKVKDEIIWVNSINNHLIKIQNGKIIDEIEIDLKASEITQWLDHLFISTNDGLLKLNVNTKKQKWINTLDGLPSNDVLDVEIISDTVYIATKKGVSKFPCNYNYVNRIKPLIFINNIAIWEKDTTLHDSYELNYNQNNVTFHFGTNSTRSQKQYTYQYRMLGIDSSWISQNSNNNIARFPTIPNGQFTFQVKAINEDGVESDIKEITLYIDTPYYKKWWFYSLIGLFIVIIVSLIFIIRIKIIKNQNSLINDKKEVEKQLSQSQLIALRSQMNPHFIFNALNSIQDYIISNNKELASDYLGLFADLMRKYLHFSNEEEITLEEEIETLDMYLQLEKVRFEETLFFSINVDENLDILGTKIPVMLIQPFAENAIKHGLLHKKGERILEINFKKKNKVLTISITDNGIGREQSAEINKMRKKEHKSFATSAQQKRIDLINQDSPHKIKIKYTDLVNTKNLSRGTLVEVILPLT